MKKIVFGGLLALVWLTACSRKGAENKRASTVQAEVLNGSQARTVFSSWVDVLGSGFRLHTKTEWTVAPSGPESEGTLLQTDRLVEETWLDVDAAKNWHLRYQSVKNAGEPMLGGEAMWVNGEYYRRLFDAPWVHRLPEAGEIQRLFAARNVLGALFEKIDPFLQLTELGEKGLLGKKAQGYAFSKRPVSQMKDPLSGKRQVDVNVLQGTWFWDPVSHIPLDVVLDVQWNTPRLDKLDEKGGGAGAVAVSCLHDWKISLRGDQQSIVAPPADPMPVRDTAVHLQDWKKVRSATGVGKRQP